MITLSAVYWLAGLMFAAYALLSMGDRLWGNAAFWGLLALSFLAGDRIGNIGNGLLVLALVALAGTRALGRSNPPTTSPGDRARSAALHRNRLFLPALIVPATALAGTLLLKHVRIGGEALLDPKQVTLISLAFGVLVAVGTILVWLRPPPLAPLQEGRRLIDAVGWAAVLPQMLASLGAVFALAKVGDYVGVQASAWLPGDSLLLAVIAYTFGMALFTIVMGNAFAAFPVMTAAIGLPLLIGRHHGDPAVIGAIGMLAGFCGTLLTPMAANFNIVPAALLDLPNRYGVIREQAGTALPLLLVNTLLIWWLAF